MTESSTKLNFMTEEEIFLSQLEMSEHAYAAARQNTAWEIAKGHAENTSIICRRLELLEIQQNQEAGWSGKMADIKPLTNLMSAEDLKRALS